MDIEKYDWDTSYEIISIPSDFSERRLLTAILERAVFDIICDYKDIRIREDAIRFFTAYNFNMKNPPPFSYLWICYHLEMDPEDFFNKAMGIGYIPSKNRKNSYRFIAY